jgi:KaiC/GvpD/RAD55 family RecA-like ATPase
MVKRGAEEDAGEGEAQPPAYLERTPSGIWGLDELIGGGVEKASTTLITGDAGCGKTTFLTQFLFNGATQYNEPGIMISFEEPREAIYKHMAVYGWDFEALEEDNLFAVINYKPHEVKKLVDEGGGLIWDAISSLGAKRLAIDSLSSYAMLFESNYQAREAQLSLFDLVRKWGCTTMLSGERTEVGAGKIANGMEYLTDGIVVLYHPRQGGVRFRALEVLKMRGTTHSQKLCPFEFVEGEGIHVYPGENVFYEMKKNR